MRADGSDLSLTGAKKTLLCADPMHSAKPQQTLPHSSYDLSVDLRAGLCWEVVITIYGAFDGTNTLRNLPSPGMQPQTDWATLMC
jgi:hypothetical protein